MEIKTIEAYNALMTGCAGCCGLPYCAEPQLECDSREAEYTVNGFIKPPEEGEPVDPCAQRYLGKVTTTVSTYARTDHTPASGDYPAYDSFISTGSYTKILTEAISQSWNRSGVGECLNQATSTRECERSGAATAEWFALRFEGGVWEPYLSSKRVGVVLGNVGGEEKPEADWANPEVPEFYPECTVHYRTTDTSYYKNFETGEWVEDVDVYEAYTTALGSGIPGITSSVTTEEYTDGFTHAAWRAACDADFAGLDFEPVGYDDEEEPIFCGKGTSCVAEAQNDFYACYTGFGMIFRKVRYRWKLAKCQGSQYYRIEWDQVFYKPNFIPNPAFPADGYRMANPEAGEANSVEHKVWEWTGTSPECDGDEESEYDEESMWSPWSLPVAVPDGELGTIALRNVTVQCLEGVYEGLWTPLLQYGIYDSEEDEEE